MSITVRIQNVYGNTTVYPVCQKAKILAALAGTKTLTVTALAQIKLLGYEITVQQQSL